MITRRNLLTSILIILGFVFMNIQCNLLVRFAPTLLQGAVALAVKGEATVVTKNGMRIRLTKNLKLSAEGLVFPGSRLITGTNSSVDLVFTDALRMRIGPNTSLTLDVARLLESRNFTQLKMRLDRGRVFAATGGKLAKSSSFVISTRRSIVNVRGTEFIVEETGSAGSVIVSNGGIAVTDQMGNSPLYVEEGKSAVIVSSGKMTLNDNTEIQKAALNAMSKDLVSMSASDKEAVKEILSSHNENKRLIKEAYEVQKELMAGDVSAQKEIDARNLKDLKDRSASDVGNVKSSAADDLRKMKEGTRLK